MEGLQRAEANIEEATLMTGEYETVKCRFIRLRVNEKQGRNDVPVRVIFRVSDIPGMNEFDPGSGSNDTRITIMGPGEIYDTFWKISVDAPNSATTMTFDRYQTMGKIVQVVVDKQAEQTKL